MKLRSAIDDLHDTTVEALDGSLRRLEYFGGLRSKDKEKKKDGEYEHWGLSRIHGDLPAIRGAGANPPLADLPNIGDAHQVAASGY